MKNIKCNLVELSHDELLTIEGGKNLLEYAAYYVGKAYGHLENAIDSMVESLGNYRGRF